MQCGAILLSRQLAADRGQGARGHADERRPLQTDGSARRNDRCMEVELTERLADAFFLKAKVTVDGKVAVRFEFACTLATQAQSSTD